MSNGTSIAKKSSPPESVMDTCDPRQYLLTCVSSFSPVQLDNIEELQMWLAQAFPASHSPLPESKPVPTTSATCGPLPQTSFAQYSLNPFCLKTSPDLFPADISEPSLLTWPRWGMWGDGELSERPTAEHPTSATGPGSWPTPAVRDYHAQGATHNDQAQSSSLATVVQKLPHKWPTPAARDWRSESCSEEFFQEREAHSRGKPLSWMVHGGPAIQGTVLNPAWVEWLMGWPIGWTDLRPLETVKFQQWLHAHGRS